MRLTTTACLLLSMLCLVAITQADTIDTVRLGHSYAFHVGDGAFKVPVFYHNDNSEVTGLSIPFHYACTGGIVTPDSIRRAGRTLGTNVFDLHMGIGNYGELNNPDSACAGFISLSVALPPGDGIIADMWFSGGTPGDLISLVPLPEGAMGGCPLLAQPPDPDGGPVHVRSDLLIVDDQIMVLCEISHEVEAIQWLDFPITVYGGAGDISVAVSDLSGPSQPATDPYISGSNPFSFRWRPGSQNTGSWTATIRATDSTGDFAEKDVYINVTPAPPDSCDIVRGDLTCEGTVDIEDLVFMASWLFTGGSPPDCPGTKLDAGKGAPDSLIFGPTQGEYAIDGNCRIPIYYYNDNDPIYGLSASFGFSSSGSFPQPDSITRAGRTYGNSIFDLFMGLSFDPGYPDSACFGAVSLSQSLPAGAGTIAYLWMSNVSPGDVISFWPIDFYPPACYMHSDPPDPDGGPILVPSAVTLGPMGLNIDCGFDYYVTASHPLTFGVNVAGGAAPYDLELVSVTGVRPGNEPVLTGSGPWTFSWTPSGLELGAHAVHFRATDDNGDTVDRHTTVTVEMQYVSPCDYLRADVNCDGEVNIADVIFIVEYMFGDGIPPDCGP